MSGRIYMLHGDSNLVSLEEVEYDSEKLLQELLAKHSDLLAGEQINSDDPRRWLLVTREMAVRGEGGASSRWSLDHLFLDQSGVPTLVEVKKGTNTDIRRKVIGQMLDYAANAVAYWSVEEIRSKFESRCERANEDPAEVLSSFLNDDNEPDDFWLVVKTNLQAGRIRLVFVSDTIPPELRRVVEFLNEQMDPAEVIAIEVKQFIGGGMKTLVPRVVGQTEIARRKKNSGTTSGQWSQESFLLELENKSGTSTRQFTETLLEWLTPQVTHLSWGKGSKNGCVIPTIQKGSTRYQLCRMGTQGNLVFRLDWLHRKPPFSDEHVQRQLLEKINAICDIHFDESFLKKRVAIPYSELNTPEATEQLKGCLTWMIDQAQAFTRRST